MPLRFFSISVTILVNLSTSFLVNRSARVERPFDYIEKNFYPGRTFSELADLNAQFRQWRDEKRVVQEAPAG